MSWRIEWHDEVASTMDLAREAAQRGEANRFVVAARAQTAGRGRAGRVWSSPPGGLYASLLLRDPPRALAPLLPLAAGLAVCRALADAAPGVEFAVKWPNDVVARRADDAPPAKIAGTLTEAGAAGDELAWVVIGFGVNLTTPAAALPETGVIPAASLATLGVAAPAPEALLALVLAEFDAVLSAHRTDPAGLARAATRRLAYRDRPVRIEPAEGRAPIVGTPVRVAADGALVLATPAGELAVSAWDAQALRPA